MSFKSTSITLTSRTVTGPDGKTSTTATRTETRDEGGKTSEIITTTTTAGSGVQRIDSTVRTGRAAAGEFSASAADSSSTGELLSSLLTSALAITFRLCLVLSSGL